VLHEDSLNVRTQAPHGQVDWDVRIFINEYFE